MTSVGARESHQLPDEPVRAGGTASSVLRVAQAVEAGRPHHGWRLRGASRLIPFVSPADSNLMQVMSSVEMAGHLQHGGELPDSTVLVTDPVVVQIRFAV